MLNDKYIPNIGEKYYTLRTYLYIIATQIWTNSEEDRLRLYNKIKGIRLLQNPEKIEFKLRKK